MRSLRYLVTLGVLAAVGCGREGPTAVGSSLLPASGIHTFELVLNAPDFLRSDTSIVGFVFASSAGFRVVAQSFGGSVFAHTLARFSGRPTSIDVRDTTTKSVITDTLPSVTAANLVLFVDTTADNGTTPVQMRLYRTVEQWDPLTVSWTMRVDSGQTHLPWATPGGTLGSLVDTATWTPGEDSVVFHVDSSTIVAWSDTTDLGRGALIAAVTAGTRLRSNGVGLTYVARSPKIRPDTTVLVNATTLSHGFIYTPNVPFRPGILQAGGTPAWRSFLVFQPELWTRSFTCPASVGTACTFTLKDVKVNSASILLTPVSPGAFPPEDSVRLQSWVVDTSSFVPLSRSPLGAQVGGMVPALSPATFLADVSSATTVAVPLTAFVAAAAGDTLLFGTGAAVSRTIAVVQSPEPSLFGVTSFYNRSAGALAPKLRLVLTLGAEVQLP